MAATPDSIRACLEAAFPAGALAKLEVADVTEGGCGSKFAVVVVSDAFEGVGLLDRQRRVNKALEGPLKSIHALTLKTWTVKEAQARGVL